eukprot:1647384-Prymnesium_polylepis.1
MPWAQTHGCRLRATRGRWRASQQAAGVAGGAVWPSARRPRSGRRAWARRSSHPTGARPRVRRASARCSRHAVGARTTRKPRTSHRPRRAVARRHTPARTRSHGVGECPSCACARRGGNKQRRSALGAP